MALIFKAKRTPKAKQAESFRRWYEKNQARLATKRQKKYQTDPAYREACIQRSREQRARARKAKS